MPAVRENFRRAPKIKGFAAGIKAVAIQRGPGGSVAGIKLAIPARFGGATVFVKIFLHCIVAL
jgi:hypothetical protein